MEMNSSTGTVDYLSAPKEGKKDWFMPVLLDNGTKIKFYCKFDPQTAVGERVMVKYGPERNGNATAYEVTKPDVDISNEGAAPTGTSTKPIISNSKDPTDMIRVGLAGRLTEAAFHLEQNKGVKFKDPEVKISEWIQVGVNAYNKSKLIEIKAGIKEAEWDDIPDEKKPF